MNIACHVMSKNIANCKEYPLQGCVQAAKRVEHCVLQSSR